MLAADLRMLGTSFGMLGADYFMLGSGFKMLATNQIRKNWVKKFFNFSLTTGLMRQFERAFFDSALKIWE